MTSSTAIRLSVCGLCFSAMLAAAPNFSGEWKMNASKSNFSPPVPAPQSMVQKIEHKDPSLKVNVTQVGQQGEVSYDLKYAIDGKEHANTVAGTERKSTLKWDGDTLVIVSKFTFGDNEVTSTDKWNLSSDGKTLTIDRRLIATQGQIDVKVVLEKQ